MTTQTNAPAFLATGAQAGDALKRGDSANSRGEALAIVTLCEARNASFEMTFATPRKEHKNGTIDRDNPVTFTLTTYSKELRSENGKVDSKAVSARKSALYSTLFGLASFTPAQDAIIMRAMSSAMYLCDNNVMPELTSSGTIKVPYRLYMPAPAADASEGKVAMYDALKDKSFSLNGKEGNSLSALRNAAKPKTDRTPASGTGKVADPAKDFRSALGLVIAAVEMCNRKGECNIAFTDADLNKLSTLAAGIATLTHNENASVKALAASKKHLKAA